MNSLHIAVSTIGAVVLLGGYVFGNGWLATLGEGFVSMKSSTALVFALCALMQTRRFFLSSAILSLASVMYVFGSFRAGIGVADVTDVETVGAGIPSLATLGCFLGLIINAYSFESGKGRNRWISIGVLVVSVTTLLGYVINSSVLRWHIPRYSTAMAIHTAIAMILWAVADLKGGP